MTTLQQALAYLQLGYSIFPAKPGLKIPALREWDPYKHKQPSKEEVINWFTKLPNANIAIVCGKVSGIIVVDVDVKSGGKETAKTLNLPITLVAKTPSGGNHYIYKWREGLVGAKVGIYPGIDIRSDLSYIIAAPSKLENGEYEWLNEGEQIADAPAWLEASTQNEKPATDWNKKLTEVATEGLRNSTSTQVAGKLLYETSPELWDTIAIGLFKQWNKDLNKPPLSDEEITTVWESVKKTHLRNNKLPEIVKSPVATVDEVGEMDQQSILRLFLKDKTKGTFLLARYMTRKYDIITIGEHEREIFIYRDGIYFQAENEIIYPEIQNVLGEHVTRAAKSETHHKICDMTSSNRDIFQTAPLRFIPLENGVYDFEDKKLLPHEAKYKFKYKFPIQYNPTATCPKTLAFLEQVLLPEQQTLVQEWMGYYFYRNYMFKKAIIFVGEGDTGKTTLLEVITRMLGPKNISSVTLQKMSGDKFSAAHLYEKHGNIVDELSANDVEDTGAFKMATGAGTITGEYKFGNQFSFQNFSKLTFACNRIPDVTDMDDIAYFNRWMVVRFEKTIEKKIPNFIATLDTTEERSGLFNWAMQGLSRLLANGQFSYSKDAMDTKKEMMRSGSSVAIFCAERITQEVGAEMTKEEMYDKYCEFCTETENSAESIKSFGSKFLFYVSYASEGTVDDYKNGKMVRSRGWKNVRIVPSKEQKLEEERADKQFNEIQSEKTSF